MLTPERKYELEQIHKGWVANPHVSNGQLADSKTILSLLFEIDALREIINHNLKEQLFTERTQGKSILDLIKERDQLTALLQDLNSRVVPGSIDTVDSLVLMKKERDQLKAENEELGKELFYTRDMETKQRDSTNYFQRVKKDLEEENQKLRERIAELREVLKDLHIHFGCAYWQGSDECRFDKPLAQDDEMEKKG